MSASSRFAAVLALMHMTAFLQIRFMNSPLQGGAVHAGMPAVSVRIDVILTGIVAAAERAPLVFASACVPGGLQLAV